MTVSRSASPPSATAPRRRRRPRAVGSEGEVQVRGYNVVPGYLDQHDDAGSFTDDGWLRTGDVGVLDEAGYLRITDRLKDIYIVGGFNVAPAEVEDVLCSHPTVSESAVIGVPDGRLGEVGAAFVIPRPGANVVTEDLREWCRERLANYKVPRTFDNRGGPPANRLRKGPEVPAQNAGCLNANSRT